MICSSCTFPLLQCGLFSHAPVTSGTSVPSWSTTASSDLGIPYTISHFFLFPPPHLSLVFLLFLRCVFTDMPPALMVGSAVFSAPLEMAVSSMGQRLVPFHRSHPSNTLHCQNLSMYAQHNFSNNKVRQMFDGVLWPASFGKTGILAHCTEIARILYDKLGNLLDLLTKSI